MDTVLTILHVAGAVFIIGPLAILPQTGLRALRAGQGAQLLTLAKSVNLFGALSLLVVVFGFGAMSLSDPKYKTTIASPWIWLSIVLYVIGAAITIFLIVPTMRRAGEQLQAASAGPKGVGAESAGAEGAGAEAVDGKAVAGQSYRSIAIGSGVSSLLLLAIVVLMVWKP